MTSRSGKTAHGATKPPSSASRTLAISLSPNPASTQPASTKGLHAISIACCQPPPLTQSHGSTLHKAPSARKTPRSNLRNPRWKRKGCISCIPVWASAFNARSPNSIILNVQVFRLRACNYNCAYLLSVQTIILTSPAMHFHLWTYENRAAGTSVCPHRGQRRYTSISNAAAMKRAMHSQTRSLRS